ncbi:MerR family transcriptional regulator [Glycomyces xiaoerkulensis]|uniref:MerR family transcriptional regulator n=1 Tax=Glycomyces xiaoerkulensis TaxID=2038139 RepID=UPI0018E4B082|nr:MerR family transcriptional regulator [Glycomyces xiaoerkulensis]
MLSIGDLARHARVSVRMLRHYDAEGLVRPQHVDPSTGYRWYSASQVGRVNALVALKELGFTLAQCRAILDEEVPAERLHRMLRTRHAELEQRIETDTRRLQEVGRRLRSIERGLTMTNDTLEFKPLPALRLAQIAAQVNDTTEIGHAIAPLFETLKDRLAAAGVAVESGGVRTYYGRPDGSKIDIAAAVPIGEEFGGAEGVEVVDLPAEARGAAVIHRGPAAEIADAWSTFDVALEEHGLTSHGLHRQVHLDGPPNDPRAVELQCPVREHPCPAPD